jgi:UPF0271 protein
MDRSIDLNADVGEIPSALVDGTEARLIGLVSSVNIACGGHAGDAASMRAVVELAQRYGVVIGAHPGYPDPDGFGRRALSLPLDELERSIASQVEELVEIAAGLGARVAHVKPHGALYNVAAVDEKVAGAIARGVQTWRESVFLVGLAGSRMLEVWRRAGFEVSAEAFADRRYEPDGTLRSRREQDALITDPAAAAQQAVDIVLHGHALAATGTPVPIAADTLCVHGDTPAAAEILLAIRTELQQRGVRITAQR